MEILQPVDFIFPGKSHDISMQPAFCFFSSPLSIFHFLKSLKILSRLPRLFRGFATGKGALLSGHFSLFTLRPFDPSTDSGQRKLRATLFTFYFLLFTYLPSPPPHFHCGMAVNRLPCKTKTPPLHRQVFQKEPQKHCAYKCLHHTKPENVPRYAGKYDANYLFA